MQISTTEQVVEVGNLRVTTILRAIERRCREDWEHQERRRQPDWHEGYGRRIRQVDDGTVMF